MGHFFHISWTVGDGNRTTHNYETDRDGGSVPFKLSAFTDFALRTGISSLLGGEGVKDSPVSELYVVHECLNLCN